MCLGSHVPPLAADQKKPHLKDWTKANASPIFKKGDRLNALNYWPVSVTYVPWKATEKLLRKYIQSPGRKLFSEQFSAWLQIGEIMPCTTVTVYEGTGEHTQQGRHHWCVYLDCRKAFYLIPYHHPLVKLRATGIGGNIHKDVLRVSYVGDNREWASGKYILNSFKWCGVESHKAVSFGQPCS